MNGWMDGVSVYVWEINVSCYLNVYFSSGDFDIGVLSLSNGQLAMYDTL